MKLGKEKQKWASQDEKKVPHTLMPSSHKRMKATTERKKPEGAIKSSARCFE